MRTTITLDPDLYKTLRQKAKDADLPFKQVVNDALRAGLAHPAALRKSSRRFRVRPIHAKLRPGIDPLHLNRLAGELDDERFIQQHRSRKAS